VRSEARLPTNTVTIHAPAEEHDGILLDRVAGWAAAGPTSFLRVNKPDWRLEVTHYDPGPLAPDAADAVADSALVLQFLDLERRGKAPRSRRELLLRSMRRVTDGVALAPQERLKLHREGYVWAVELGRWDGAAVAGLERQFLTQRAGIAALLASPCDAASETRWKRLARADGPSEAAVTQARTTIGLHANRLGVFAEVEAILHYFLFRLDSDQKRA
jgi:hypothetical protein